MKFLILFVAIFVPILNAQQNLPYSRNIQWVDLARPTTIYAIGYQQITGTVSVNNFPPVQIVSGTVMLNDTTINRVVIRDDTANRNLNVNTYNGLDVRLTNNAGTLISDTNPLAVKVQTGTINVNNFPPVQIVSGTVSVSNFPTKQSVYLQHPTNNNIAHIDGWGRLSCNVDNNFFNPYYTIYSVNSYYYVDDSTDTILNGGSHFRLTGVLVYPGTNSYLEIQQPSPQKTIAYIDTRVPGYQFVPITVSGNIRIINTGSPPAKITIFYQTQ